MINHELLKQAFMLAVKYGLLLRRSWLLSLLADALRSGWSDCIDYAGNVELL